MDFDCTQAIELTSDESAAHDESNENSVVGWLVLEDNESEIFPLAPGVYAVGRDASCDICIRSHSLSRRHAEIRVVYPGAFLLTDNQSRNGTRVNNVPLKPDKERGLMESDVIKFGDVSTRLTTMDPNGNTSSMLSEHLPGSTKNYKPVDITTEKESDSEDEVEESLLLGGGFNATPGVDVSETVDCPISTTTTVSPPPDVDDDITGSPKTDSAQTVDYEFREHTVHGLPQLASSGSGASAEESAGRKSMVLCSESPDTLPDSCLTSSRGGSPVKKTSASFRLNSTALEDTVLCSESPDGTSHQIPREPIFSVNETCLLSDIEAHDETSDGIQVEPMMSPVIPSSAPERSEAADVTEDDLDRAFSLPPTNGDKHQTGALGRVELAAKIVSSDTLANITDLPNDDTLGSLLKSANTSNVNNDEPSDDRASHQILSCEDAIDNLPTGSVSISPGKLDESVSAFKVPDVPEVPSEKTGLTGEVIVKCEDDVPKPGESVFDADTLEPGVDLPRPQRISIVSIEDEDFSDEESAGIVTASQRDVVNTTIDSIRTPAKDKIAKAMRRNHAMNSPTTAADDDESQFHSLDLPVGLLKADALKPTSQPAKRPTRARKKLIPDEIESQEIPLQLNKNLQSTDGDSAPVDDSEDLAPDEPKLAPRSVSASETNPDKKPVAKPPPKANARPTRRNRKRLPSEEVAAKLTNIDDEISYPPSAKKQSLEEPKKSMQSLEEPQKSMQSLEEPKTEPAELQVPGLPEITTVTQQVVKCESPAMRSRNGRAKRAQPKNKDSPLPTRTSARRNTKRPQPDEESKSDLLEDVYDQPVSPELPVSKSRAARKQQKSKSAVGSSQENSQEDRTQDEPPSANNESEEKVPTKATRSTRKKPNTVKAPETSTDPIVIAEKGKENIDSSQEDPQKRVTPPEETIEKDSGATDTVPKRKGRQAAKTSSIAGNVQSTPPVAANCSRRGRAKRLPVSDETRDSSVESSVVTEEPQETPSTRDVKTKSSSRKRGKNDLQELSSETPPKRSLLDSPSVGSSQKRGRSSISGSAAKSGKPLVMFTGFKDNETAKFGKQLVSLGGQVVDDVFKCTHLVTDKIRRTRKFLCALARGIPIVSTAWLTGSSKNKSLLDDSAYTMVDKESEKKFNMKLTESLNAARANCGVFSGMKFFVTPSVKPVPSELKDMILCAKGELLPRSPAQVSQRTFVISCDEDRKKIKQSLLPCARTAEFILSGIMNQCVVESENVL